MADKAQPQTNAAEPLTTEEVLAAEARAIHGDAAAGASGKVNSELYRELNRLDSAALCLSGGGIRSAAFALGVIQALATHPRPLGTPNKPVDNESNSLLANFTISPPCPAAAISAAGCKPGSAGPRKKVLQELVANGTR